MGTHESGPSFLVETIENGMSIAKISESFSLKLWIEENPRVLGDKVVSVPCSLILDVGLQHFFYPVTVGLDYDFSILGFAQSLIFSVMENAPFVLCICFYTLLFGFWMLGFSFVSLVSGDSWFGLWFLFSGLPHLL